MFMKGPLELGGICLKSDVCMNYFFFFKDLGFFLDSPKQQRTVAVAMFKRARVRTSR